MLLFTFTTIFFVSLTVGSSFTLGVERSLPQEKCPGCTISWGSTTYTCPGCNFGSITNGYCTCADGSPCATCTPAAPPTPLKDYPYWCVRNNNHGCCCTSGGLGTLCNFPDGSGIRAGVINSSVTAFSNTWHGRAFVFVDGGDTVDALLMTPLDTDLWAVYWQWDSCGCGWKDINYIGGGSKHVCSIPQAELDTHIKGVTDIQRIDIK